MSDGINSVTTMSSSDSTPPVIPSGNTSGVPQGNTAQSPTQQLPDTSALIAQFERRINDLMSQKDKSIHERNQAISQLTELQQQYTQLQEQTQNSLTGAANAAQQAIERSKQLEVQMGQLQGQVTRSQVLLEKPHLAPYAQFIPASGDEAKIKEAVDQLEQIRQQDIARQATMQQYPLPGTQSVTSSNQTASSPTPGQLANLYAGRANMTPSFTYNTIGSTPSQMHPAAMTDPIAAIEQLFQDARTSGDAQAFERAVQQASLLSQTAINQQLGRSSS